MKATTRAIKIWFIAISLWQQAICLLAADGKRPSEFACELNDGSRIVGVLSIETFSVRTDYARLKLPVESIRILTLASNREGMKFEMDNGDIIIGVLQQASFKLNTALGEVELSAAQLTKMSAVQFAAAGSDFNVSRDFSLEANPNGVWSYGWATTLGGSFRSFTHKLPPNNYSTFGWKGVGEAAGAYIQTGSQPTHPHDTMTINPGQVGLHPGAAGEFSIIRWTAPKGGGYRITGNFIGLSGYNGAPPTTTDVHVLRTGKSLFESFLNLHGNGNEAAFDLAPEFEAGDTVDFVVGFGNGFYGSDSTGLNVTLTLVAKPTTKNNTPVRRAK